MKYEDLKNKLLTIDIFYDNEWLDKYIQLMIDNLKTKKEKYRTAAHHIIPRHYFKGLNLPEDNSKNNLVNLCHTDHCKAHLYLSLASKTAKYISANAGAMWFILGHPQSRKNISEDDIEKFLEYIDSIDFESIIDYSKSEECKAKHRQKVWITDGKIEIQINKGEQPPKGFKNGRLKINTDNSNTVWVNNGKIQKHIKKDALLEYLDSGYVLGMLPRCDSWYQNVGRYERTPEIRKNISKSNKSHLPEVRAKISNSLKGSSSATKGRISITDGVKNKFIFKEQLVEYENLGWHRGSTQNHRKRK